MSVDGDAGILAADEVPPYDPRSTSAPVDQGAEMQAFMSIDMAFATYSEGMTRAATNAQLWDPGTCRR